MQKVATGPNMPLSATPETRYNRLADLHRPLLDKFYRSHRSPMRLPAHGHAWVAQAPEVVAALCLTPVRHGHWLTGLFVAPAQREQGIARQLIAHALYNSSGPVWLFCHPQLMDFYQKLGFAQAQSLPAELADRLQRYQRQKPLIALVKEVNRLPSDPDQETALR